MRKLRILVVFAFVAGTSCAVYGQEGLFSGGGILDALTPILSAVPTAGGGLIRGALGAQWLERVSSMVRVRREYSTEDTAIAGTDESLLVSKSSTTVIDAYVAEYSFRTSLDVPGEIPRGEMETILLPRIRRQSDADLVRGLYSLDGSEKVYVLDSEADGYALQRLHRALRGPTYRVTLGGGANVTVMDLEERGYFVLPGVDGNQAFANNYDVTFVAPALRFGASLETSSLRIEYGLFASPLYRLSFDQTMSISPLVAETGTNTFAAWGAPLLENDLRIRVLDFLGLHGVYEYQRLNFRQLDLVSDGVVYSFAALEKPYAIHRYTVFGEVLIPFDAGSRHSIVVGFGRTGSLTRDLLSGESLVDEGEWLFNVGFDGLTW